MDARNLEAVKLACRVGLVKPTCSAYHPTTACPTSLATTYMTKNLLRV